MNKFKIAIAVSPLVLISSCILYPTPYTSAKLNGAVASQLSCGAFKRVIEHLNPVPHRCLGAALQMRDAANIG